MTQQPAAKILVVDDHPTNRIKLSLSVKKLGYETAEAGDGQEALDQLRSAPYDLVLLDLMMPVMDGYEVLSALRDSPDLRNIPVIVISALDEVDAVVRAIELGAEDHLPKSFDPVLLRARVSACLEKKRLRDQEVEYLQQVDILTSAAEVIEADDFSPDTLDLASVAARPDALGRLARVLSHMASEVYQREQTLKRRVQSLQIQIDETRQKEQVNSITGTDYFRDLRVRADDLRSMLKGQENGDADEQPPGPAPNNENPEMTKS